MKQKILNLLIKTNLLDKARFVIGLFKIIRNKFLLFPLFIKTSAFRYKTTLLSDTGVIRRILSEKGLYHPVMDYDFSLVNVDNKQPYAYIVKIDKEELIIRVVV